MSQVEQVKQEVCNGLEHLCAHCQAGRKHDCPIKQIQKQISALRGVPLIVNNHFHGLLWTKAPVA